MLDPNVTPPDQWNGGRFSGQIVLLPSGNRVRLRRTLSLMDAMKSGTLPNPLTKLIEDSLKFATRGTPTTEAEAKEQEQEALKSFMDMDQEGQMQLFELIDNECVQIFMSPKLVIPPKTDENGDPVDARLWKPENPDEMSIVDVSWDDRIYAYNWAQGAPMDLARFRKTTAAMADVAHEFAVSHETQRATGD